MWEYNLGERIQFFENARFDTGETDAQGRALFRKATTREQTLAMAVEPLSAQAMHLWPDVILGISAFFTPPPLLDVYRARGIKVVLWHTESPYQDAEQLERAEHADINLVNDPVNLAAYEQHGPAVYQPHCYRPKVHYPGCGLPYEYDLSFVGTGYPSRQAFFEAMNFDGLDVALAGGFPGMRPDSPLRKYLTDPAMALGADITEMACLDNDQAAELYRVSKAGINLYRREASDGDTADGVAMGPREVEMASCGLFYLRDPRPEGDELLPMLPTFTGPEDASEQLRWWLAHDTQRELAAAAARRAVAGRTFDAAARRLITLTKKG